MAWNPLLVAMRVHGPAPEPIRESIESMPLADAVHTRGGRLNVVIALQVRGDPNRVQIIGPPQVQDLLDDLVGSFLYSGACGWLRVLLDGCGCLWMVVGACGWLWVLVDGCGCLRMVAGACGCLRMVVDACGWLRVLLAACGSRI